MAWPIPISTDNQIDYFLIHQNVSQIGLARLSFDLWWAHPGWPILTHSFPSPIRNNTAISIAYLIDTGQLNQENCNIAFTILFLRLKQTPAGNTD